MTNAPHVYQTHIRASPQRVWTAITDPEWLPRFFFGIALVEPLRVGQPFAGVLPDGSPAVDGLVEVLEPPRRLRLTWRVRYHPAMAREHPYPVEWELVEADHNLTRVRLGHGQPAANARTAAAARKDWLWVLDSLKSLLETGSGLPIPTTGPGARSGVDVTSGEWHRAQAVAANNSIWELLDSSDRSAADNEELLRRAYAAAYHWDRAAGTGPPNAARAHYMIAKAQLSLGRPDLALAAAERCLMVCRAAGLADFDLAYAHEATARALHGLGRVEEALEQWAMARGVEIAEPEDREILERDFADLATVLTDPAVRPS